MQFAQNEKLNPSDENQRIKFVSSEKKVDSSKQPDETILCPRRSEHSLSIFPCESEVKAAEHATCAGFT